MTANHYSLALALVMTAATPGFGQPAITLQPQSQTNVLGTTATFSVTATGSSALTYQWFFGSVPENLDGETNSTLVLQNIQSTNQGPYQVVVTNLGGAVTSAVANLYVVGPPTLQFSASSYTVSESAGSVTLTVQRNGWLASVVSVDYATADGTATNGAKYTAVSGTLAFASGETSKTITVPILNEGYVEGTKVFRVLLSNPTGGAVLGSRTNAIVNITDNDSGTQFQFPTNSVAQDAGEVVLRVVRDDDGILPATVDVFTTDVSAVSGVDYAGLTNTLSFGPQERVKLVPVPLLNNNLKQPNRIFRATLANPVGFSLGGQRTTTVTIINSNQGFQFDSASYSVAQDAGVVRLGVLRGSDVANSAVTVDLATTDSTAVSGADYTGTTNTLAFGPGEKVKVVLVHILNNGLKSPTKFFRAALSNPTMGAVLGSPTSVTVRILNSDPGVSFEATSYTNAWSAAAGSVTMTVLRGNAAALGPINVDYATSDVSARAGVDYQAISGTLQFQQNETVKSLSVPILRNRPPSGVKSFRVTLDNPTGGAALGTAATSVYLLGAYVTVAPGFDTSLTIGRLGAAETVSWSGGGLLQRADSPAGPWQELTNAASPFAVQSPIPTTFYRVTRPRPVDVYVPSVYDGQTPLPLVVLLHHYTATGDDIESYFRLQPLAETRGFLYCHPDSNVDPWGNPFWNATDACCDFWNTGVDDAGNLRALIEAIASQFAVDRKRIYLTGFSNGGFMAHRMACESADLIAAIAADAGVGFLDPSRCHPVAPVNILHIHGTADPTVFYGGGAATTINSFAANLPQFPGVLQLMQFWAGYNGASGPVTDPAPTLDLTTDVPGLDTVVTRYTNAPPGGAVELWTVNGATHGFTTSPEFSPLVIDWLLAHPKP